LYGLKTSAARFYEHLSESLLRLGFKKTKHDFDLWMFDKSSHYEYLATYVDDILIWSEDPMEVIKSKSVGIPEYYLGENVEFLGEAWTFKTSSRNFKLFLEKSLSPSRHP
jgi:hypothetical protein